MLFKTPALLLLTGLITGCATPQVYNYSPSSTMTVNGQMLVGSFRYLPALGNNPIKPNQIDINTTLEPLFLDKNVNEYFEEALFNEARMVGIYVTGGVNSVGGEIVTFSREVSFPNATFNLEIRYQLTKQDNLVCYDKTYKSEKIVSGFNEQWNSVWNEVIKLNIEKVFNDPDFVVCIQAQEKS